MSAADNTRHYLTLMHEHVLRIDGAIQNALHKIGDDAEWHPESLEIIFLRNDVRSLRQMADDMESKLNSLTMEKAS